VAVLDVLGWRSAHVVDRSTGGTIAQTLAFEHPDRVRSLRLFGSTLSWRIGREKLATTLRLLRARLATRRLPNARGVEERLVAASRVFGSPGYRLDEAWVCRAALAKVCVPTLVVTAPTTRLCAWLAGRQPPRRSPRQTGGLPGHGPRPARR
jgi:pimeloyl-ACP methyl ester carboxylesterase